MEEVITRDISVQVSCSLVSEIPVPDTGGDGSRICGREFEAVMRVERDRSVGDECLCGSHSSGVGDTSEIVGIESDGYIEREDGDQIVQEFSEIEEEAVLGESFLGQGILCEYNWD